MARQTTRGSGGRGGNGDGSGLPPAGEEPTGAVEPIEIQEEMERSFLEYSMSVIVSRALPDVRDGLKPVHRRILYSMFDRGLRPDRPHNKCAKVVGDVMGTYHPHGDSAIYEALARMVQEFSLRHPLIDGHGNFGGRGPDDGAAAMRYTECRLAPLALELMADIDEETVDMVANYDGSDEEPTVLPGRFPNLLINGSQGIAVGMATNIPPHNMGEVIDAAIHVLHNPEATPDDLMAFVKGPDFPTGALILGRQGILDAYRTGRGSIKMRAVAEIEEGRVGDRIVVTEFPYQTSVEVIEQKISDLVKAGELDGISGVLNSSANQKPRLVIELKRDANANVVLNNLYKQTPLQTSFGVNLLALVDSVPRTLNLAQALSYYIDHQIEVVTRRTQFRLRKAQERAHIVEGLLRAIDMLDAVIATIRGSDDRPSARTSLMADPFLFTEIQATHILDMTLGRLTRLGRTELQEEMAKLLETIAELEAILADDTKLRAVIAEEMTAIRDKFANPRRSIITHDPGEMGVEDLIDDEEIVVTMTKGGYIKSVAAAAFRTQGRGGRGVQGARLKEEDLVPLAPNESVQAIITTREFSPDQYLVFATAQGQVKKTALSEYDKSRREGFIAINLRDGDELVRVVATSGTDDIFEVTRSGMTIRFNEEDVRSMGRDAAGVRGIRLRAGDAVVSCDVAADDTDILLVTDAGYGKRTKLERFNRQARGGQGVRGIRLTGKRGSVVAAFMVALDEEILLVSSGGVVIRTAAREIASQGRDATGVRVMNLDDGQSVAAVARVTADEVE
jgi:DNA gyrase subunit A